MICIIVNEIRKHEINPSKAQYLAVALKIVKQYPKSFSDFDDAQKKNLIRHIRMCKLEPELPLANSDDVLEEKRQTLETLYQRYGKSGADRGDVCALMKETYYVQRKHINGTKAPPIKDLKSKWPYLFVKKHIYAHFEELTSIAIHKRLDQAIQEYGKVLVDFLKSKSTNYVVKKVLSSKEEEYRPLVIKLILAHFREDPDGLLLLANVSILLKTTLFCFCMFMY